MYNSIILLQIITFHHVIRFLIILSKEKEMGVIKIGCLTQAISPTFQSYYKKNHNSRENNDLRSSLVRWGISKKGFCIA